MINASPTRAANMATAMVAPGNASVIPTGEASCVTKVSTSSSTVIFLLQISLIASSISVQTTSGIQKCFSISRYY